MKRSVFLNIKQKVGQPFDTYLTELKNAADRCEYNDQTDSIIRDLIIFGLKDRSLQEKLLNEKELTLEKTAEYCRSNETSKKQLKEIAGEEECSINTIKSDNVKARTQIIGQKINNCRNCGYSML